jgi:hypothetical protein
MHVYCYFVIYISLGKTRVTHKVLSFTCVAKILMLPGAYQTILSDLFK